jgi:hypothetical protein
MQPDWPAEIHRELAAAGVAVVGYVPDAGHKRLIELCQADRNMRAVVLTTAASRLFAKRIPAEDAEVADWMGTREHTRPSPCFWVISKASNQQA